MDIQDELLIFHPDCGGIFTGAIERGAIFECAECGLKVPGLAVIAFAEGYVPEKHISDIKRRLGPSRMP